MPVLIPLKVAAGEPILRGFDFLWQQIREAGARGREFTISEIDSATNDKYRRSAADFMKRLVKASIAVRTGWVETRRRDGKPSRAVAHTYKLVVRPVETPALDRNGKPLTGKGRAQSLWTAIRGLKTFTSRELAVAASTEELPVSLPHASLYATALRDAGYLIASGPKHRLSFQLKPSMNTGPKAPRLLRTRMVFDPNRGVVAGEIVAEQQEDL